MQQKAREPEMTIETVSGRIISNHLSQSRGVFMRRQPESENPMGYTS